jgi:hypothetical protein
LPRIAVWPEIDDGAARALARLVRVCATGTAMPAKARMA